MKALPAVPAQTPVRQPVPSRAEAAAGFPFVSVVLPVRNEEDHIDACLERLLKQDYPQDRFEILVVDGRSTDATRDRVRELQKLAGGERLRLIDNPARIVPPALNAGIRHARGEVIVRMDGHTVPESDYISACVRALAESGAANVGGPMVPNGDTPFAAAVAAALQHPLGVGDAKFHFQDAGGFVDTVYMGAFRKEVFARAGLFDESMVRNQDYEMNVRIRKAGGRIFLDPRIRSSYTPRSDLRSLFTQFFQYGWWRVETLRRHPDSLRWRQLVPPVFVAASLLLGLLAVFLPVARLGLISLLGVYLLALSGAAASEAPRLPAQVRWRVPLVLATIHFSWGLGFLVSLLSAGRLPFRAEEARAPVLDLSQETP